jgi:hypothetical protein
MKKSKSKAKKTTARDGRGGGDSPESVLVEIDKFVAARKVHVERLTDRVIKAKKSNPTLHRELQRARNELSEALRLRVRVAKVVMDVEQRLRLVENSARFAIATAFAEYQQRTSRRE